MTESTEEPQATSTTSEADADHQGGTAAPEDPSLAGVPDDLRPGEDNPLAEPLDPDAEATKDADELGMQDTQDDTTGTYRSSGEVEESDTTSADTDSKASADSAAQEASES